MEIKKIVVTGGTEGIGREIVRLFAARDWQVAFCSRNPEKVAALSAELNTKGAPEHLAWPCDLSKKDEADRFADRILSLWLHVDVLVNNAGTFIPGQIHTEPDHVLSGLWEQNVMSTYHCCRAFVPSMKNRKDGHIINMCSVASTTAYPNGGSYGITKFAQYGLTKNLREELKDFGIGVTALLPGATRTGSWDGTDLPESRFIAPEHIAQLIYQCVNIRPRSVVEDLVIRPQEGDLD